MVYVRLLVAVVILCCERLGDYETHQFSDKRVEKPLARFQQAIEDIEVDMVDE